MKQFDDNMDSWTFSATRTHLTGDTHQWRVDVWCARRKHSFIAYSEKEVLAQVRSWTEEINAKVAQVTTQQKTDKQQNGR